MTIYYENFYNIVIAVFALTLAVIAYLLYINIATRSSLKSNAPAVVWRGTKQCLLYLRMLHVNSWLMIACLLVKHLDILPNRISCEIVNQIWEISTHLYRVSIWLVWQTRHRTMSLALLRENSIMAPWMWFFTKLLVFLPLTTLPFVLVRGETQWNQSEDYNCIAHTPVYLGRVEMYISLAVCVTFFSLFVAQIWQAYRTINEDLKVSFATEMPDPEETLKNIQQFAKSATFRNCLVTFFAFFWMIVYYCPLNHDEPASSTALQHDVYSERLVLGLDQLTNNVVLYFVFRDWRFFLLYPCQEKSRKSVALEVEGTWHSSVYSTTTALTTCE